MCGDEGSAVNDHVDDLHLAWACKICVEHHEQGLQMSVGGMAPGRAAVLTQMSRSPVGG